MSQRPKAPHGAEQTEGHAYALAAAVLLCADLKTLGGGLDIQELVQWLASSSQNVKAYALPDLCRTPKAIAPTVRDAERVVLAVCSSDFAEIGARQQVQQAGLDPLATVVLNLGAFAALLQDRGLAMEKAKALLAGAVARSRASPRAAPENRRSLLTLLGQEDVVRCQACGRPVVTTLMLNRLRALLGKEDGGLAAHLAGI